MSCVFQRGVEEEVRLGRIGFPGGIPDCFAAPSPEELRSIVANGGGIGCQIRPCTPSPTGCRVQRAAPRPGGSDAPAGPRSHVRPAHRPRRLPIPQSLQRHGIQPARRRCRARLCRSPKTGAGLLAASTSGRTACASTRRPSPPLWPRPRYPRAVPGGRAPSRRRNAWGGPEVPAPESGSWP